MIRDVASARMKIRRELVHPGSFNARLAGDPFHGIVGYGVALAGTFRLRALHRAALDSARQCGNALPIKFVEVSFPAFPR
jgi:hypothetical protein